MIEENARTKGEEGEIETVVGKRNTVQMICIRVGVACAPLWIDIKMDLFRAASPAYTCKDSTMSMYAERAPRVASLRTSGGLPLRYAGSDFSFTDSTLMVLRVTPSEV